MSRTHLNAPPAQRPGELRASAAFAGRFAIGTVRATVADWTRRVRYRRALARMSERELIDIGVTWSSIETEASKPFWRA